MSVPPNPIPTPNPAFSGYTHHMHHLGSLQGLHSAFDSKAIPSAPGPGGYHHYDHYRWNRQFQRGYQRAPVRTKVLWFLLGVGATSFFSRRHHNHPSNQSPFSPPTFISAQTDTPQSQPSWRCRTRASARSSPPPDMAPGGMTMMEPITIGQALPKATEMTRDEAIRSTFEGSATATPKDKQLTQINELLQGMNESQLGRLGRIVKEFAV